MNYGIFRPDELANYAQPETDLEHALLNALTQTIRRADQAEYELGEVEECECTADEIAELEEEIDDLKAKNRELTDKVRELEELRDNNQPATSSSSNVVDIFKR